MFSILDRYIGKTILNTIGICLFLLISLSGIIRFIDQLRRIKFVMETSGFSRFKIALAVMKTALPLVLITMAVGEWVAPISEQTARNMRSEKLYGNSLLSERGSLWAKDNNDYIFIGHVNSDNSISNIDIYSVDKNRLLSITHADSGTFENGEWTLSQIEMNDLTNPQQVIGTNLLNMPWKTNITPDKLSIVAFDPESLSASGLKPISVAVMLLLALSFIFGPLRSVSMGVRVIIGISFGFIFYIADNLFAQTSIVIGIYPFVGSMLTSLVFLLISYILFKRKN